MAYAMYYKASGTGREPKCPDFEYDFNKAVQERITARVSSGRVLTVSQVIESALVTQISAFSFNIKSVEPVDQIHLKSLEGKLSEKWTAQLSGTYIF